MDRQWSAEGTDTHVDGQTGRDEGTNTHVDGQTGRAEGTNTHVDDRQGKLKVLIHMQMTDRGS